MFLGRLLTFVGPILEMLGAYLSWSVYKEPGDSVRLRGDRFSGFYPATRSARNPLEGSDPHMEGFGL